MCSSEGHISVEAVCVCLFSIPEMELTGVGINILR